VGQAGSLPDDAATAAYRISTFLVRQAISSRGMDITLYPQRGKEYKVADLTGETLTDAVRHALRERWDREMRNRPDPLFIERLLEISDRRAARTAIDTRSDNELVGYDDLGIPQ
jgi:antitoxin VapB